MTPQIGELWVNKSDSSKMVMVLRFARSGQLVYTKALYPEGRSGYRGVHHMQNHWERLTQEIK